MGTAATAEKASDKPQSSFSNVSKEPLWKSYFRLTRLHLFPVGNILLIFPTLWGLTMAAYATKEEPKTFMIQTVLFALGSTLLHSAACVINDIADVEFDRQVERCKNRPLASGAVSMTGAWLLLASLTLPTCAMLLLTNETAAFYGIFGVFPLHALYPYMKRWTWWPQAWLGLAMNWGFITAWIAVTGSPDWHLLGIGYLGTFFWTIVYDTIYACQDRRDDSKAGVKSTALLFGDWVRSILSVFAMLFLGCLGYSGYLNNQGIYFYSVSLGGSVLFFLWNFLTWNPEEPTDCLAKFIANGNYGYIVWAGLVLDYYSKQPESLLTSF